MNTTQIRKMREQSYLTDGNFAYIEALYDDYLVDPRSVSDYWQTYFSALNAGADAVAGEVPASRVREYFIRLAKANGMGAQQSRRTDVPPPHQHEQANLHGLIHAYRAHGHHLAKLDPLAMQERKVPEDLQLHHHGFSNADYNKQFSGFNIGASDASLGSIFAALQRTYADTLGVEFLHITDPEETRWLQAQLESVHSHPALNKEQKFHIYRQLTAAEGLEKYLGLKYVGQKRFSLEGAVALIPMLDELVQRAGSRGVKELIAGMAHRGRLNVLVNILGKSPEQLFKEFEGKARGDDSAEYSGDVKYHMGFSSDVETSGGILHLALAFNPSHLEIINPVVAGSVRARQERRQDVTHDQVIPVLIHGDAAIAGQGVVAEMFNFSQARGFNTGGAIHIVINNQIGFTTSNPLDARSTLYCTDSAKVVQAPVFHVNGDDPEACVFAMQLAFDYRMRFKKDVLVDLVCYRRHGHNEADEPSSTQPRMYRIIKNHLRTREIYANRLIAEKVMTEAETSAEVIKYRDILDAGDTVVQLVPREKNQHEVADWRPYIAHEWHEKVITGVAMASLKVLGKKMTTIPQDFPLQAQVKREYDARRKMVAGELPLNWGFAETLAYATLLTEGYPVRLCGQDSGRGTFSHRHGVLHHHEDGSLYVPLQHLTDTQKTHGHH